MFSLYQYLIVNLGFSHLGFRVELLCTSSLFPSSGLIFNHYFSQINEARKEHDKSAKYTSLLVEEDPIRAQCG